MLAGCPGPPLGYILGAFGLHLGCTDLPSDAWPGPFPPQGAAAQPEQQPQPEGGLPRPQQLRGKDAGGCPSPVFLERAEAVAPASPKQGRASRKVRAPFCVFDPNTTVPITKHPSGLFMIKKNSPFLPSGLRMLGDTVDSQPSCRGPWGTTCLNLAREGERHGHCAFKGLSLAAPAAWGASRPPYPERGPTLAPKRRCFPFTHLSFVPGARLSCSVCSRLFAF